MEKTVVKAIELIEVLSDADKPVGVTALAAMLGLTKSNVFRLLNTLVQLGYVRRLEDAGHYELTLKMWSVSSKLVSRLDVKRAASPHIERLMRSSNESVHLSVFADGGVIYVDKLESEQPVRAYSRIGDRPPAHCVATGKVLLAYLPDALLSTVLAGGLKRFTPNTITDEVALRQELHEIRATGYATNRGEWRASVCGVAAPIRDWSGVVVAAVGISGPSERLRPEMLDQIAPRVISCARAISSDIGYSDSNARDEGQPAAERPRRRSPPNSRRGGGSG